MSEPLQGGESPESELIVITRGDLRKIIREEAEEALCALPEACRYAAESLAAQIVGGVLVHMRNFEDGTRTTQNPPKQNEQ